MNAKSKILKNEIYEALNQSDLISAQQLLYQYVFMAPKDYWGWMVLGGILKPEVGKKYLLKAQELAPNNKEVDKAVRLVSNNLTISGMDDQHKEKTRPQIPSQPEALPIEEKEKSRWFIWVRTSLTAIVLLVLIGLLVIGLASFLRGSEPVILGHQIIIVTSGSMEPVFYTGSLIFVNTSLETQSLAEGDIVMFRSPDNPQTKVTHRIIEVDRDQDGIFYRTQGDNNDYIDPIPIRDHHIIGQYANITFTGMGYFFSFIKSRNGMILLAMIFGLFLIITQAVKIKEYLISDEDG